MTFNLTHNEVTFVALAIGIILTFSLGNVLSSISDYFDGLARVAEAQADALETDTEEVEELQADIDHKDDVINNLLDDVARDKVEHYNFCKELLEKLLSAIALMNVVKKLEPTPTAETAFQPGDVWWHRTAEAETHIHTPEKVEPNASEPVPTSEGSSGLDSQSA